MFSAPQYSTSELQQYNYFVMQEPVFEEKIEEPVFMHVYKENGALFCASSTSERGYHYTYVLNNPLKYTDPSGYSSQDFYDEEARMTSNRGDSDKTEAGGSYHFFAGYDPRTGRFNPYHRYSGFSASFPGASMVGRFVRYNGPTGVYYDKSTKSVQYTYQDYLTGSAYRNVEYVKDYYNVTTDSEGNKSYTYMYTVDDGVRKVPMEDSNAEDARALTLSGLTLLTQGGLEVFQGSNQGVRAAAIRNGIPTEVIDEIILRTGNFQNISQWAGRGFVAAGVVVNVIDGVQAYNNGDRAGMTRAGMDLLAGLGTAAIGGPAGIILYGGYMLIMHAPVVAEPAFMSDPASNWNRLPRIDNTHVAPVIHF